MMYTFIINAENHNTVLLSTSNPSSVFVSTFIQKLDENENTRVILESKCLKGHEIKSFVMRAVFTMFNIFSKSLVAGGNSKIHKKQKRTVKDDAKMTSTARKLKKLSSE